MVAAAGLAACAALPLRSHLWRKSGGRKWYKRGGALAGGFSSAAQVCDR